MRAKATTPVYTGKTTRLIQKKGPEKTYHPTNSALENAQKNFYKRIVLISNLPSLGIQQTNEREL